MFRTLMVVDKIPLVTKCMRLGNTRAIQQCRRGVSQRRNITTTDIPPQQAFWNTNRVVLLTAFTGAVAYVIGISDLSSSNVKTTPKIKQPVYATKKGMEKVIAELRSSLGEDTISTDDDDLHRHGFSEWSSINIDVLPVAVAYPRSTAEVAQIAKLCNEHKIPIIPYSGGTSLEGNFSAPFGGMSIDFAFMDSIVALHAEDMDVVVQPSMSYMALNEQLKSEGLFFPVDPGPTAKIGGMVGTGGSGTNAVRYGTMRDWVINLTIVLANGTVIKTRGRPRKSAAGYNLTQLFVGSEGTLGIITEITLKLAVVPQETMVAVVTFPTIRDAAAAASEIMKSGVPIAAMELMDDVQMQVVNWSGATKKKWKEVPTMFFKFSGTKAGVKDNIDNVKKIAKSNKCGDFEFAANQEEQAALWSARKEALWSMLAMKEDEGQSVWSTDVAVPFSRLPDLIEVTKKDLQSLGLFASALGHIGDGNFHTSILYRHSDPAERKKVEDCVHNMVDRALEMEGTCTGEHGVGLGKKAYLLKELGPVTVDVMRQIKRTLDPNWVLNPGKIFDA